MSNEIVHYTIIIDADLWFPFQKACEKEYDRLIHDIKDKTQLGHFGNVVTRMEMKRVKINDSNAQ